MTERRAAVRQRTLYRGVLSFNNGNSTEDCIVRNLSETGGQIELTHPHAPEVFDLIVAARHLHRRASAVWRSGGRIGLAFDGAEMATSPRPFASKDDLRY